MILSVVLPAYNEAGRLPAYLLEVQRYLDKELPGEYEVIVVDDGSRDGMVEQLRTAFVGWRELRFEVHAVNRGKGAAVRTGVLSARGGLILFADADGATPIAEERKLREAIAAGADIAVGSRLVVDAKLSVKRSRRRELAGRLFSMLVCRLFHLTVRDVQCGFKMFRHEAGVRLFQSCRMDGYIFDVSILAKARRLNYQTSEVPVDWSEKSGSKVSLISDSCKLVLDLVRLRFAPEIEPDAGNRPEAGTILDSETKPKPLTALTFLGTKTKSIG